MNRSRTALALGVGLLVLAGCDYPTEAPQLEQRWILPVETTTIGVDELLPSGVTVSGSNFAVSVDPFAVVRSLGSVCSGCSDSGGLAVPYPGFDSQFNVDQTLPADVTAASLSGGTVQLTINNGFGFDPIRLASGGTGTLTVTLTDGPGGAALGQVVMDGASEQLPGGSTVVKTVTLASASIGNTISASVDITSPAGTSPTDDVAMDLSQSITVTATPTNILVASATVNVANQTVEIDSQDVDMEDIDESITDHIQQGSVILDVANPFGVSVTGTLSIGPTSKSLNIPASATSEVTITYTGDELRSFLGKPNIQFSGSGSVSASGPVTVSPGQVVTLEASVDLTILIG